MRLSDDRWIEPSPGPRAWSGMQKVDWSKSSFVRWCPYSFAAAAIQQNQAFKPFTREQEADWEQLFCRKPFRKLLLHAYQKTLTVVVALNQPCPDAGVKLRCIRRPTRVSALFLQTTTSIWTAEPTGTSQTIMQHRSPWSIISSGQSL